MFKVGDRVKWRGEGDYTIIAVDDSNIPYKIRKTNGLDYGWAHELSIELFTKKHPHANLIKAWADDTSIEFEFRTWDTDTWMDCNKFENWREEYPKWNREYQYRIKPKVCDKCGQELKK